ncbi:hypothetical protein [Lelliottia nimipressuralis]
MVSAETLLQQLLYVDSLLAMDGIVPSHSQYQDRMGRIIVALDTALCENSSSPQEVKRFCTLLCQLIDWRIRDKNLRTPGYWPRLAQHLYGVEEPQKPFSTQLEALLSNSSGELLKLSKMLLVWLPSIEEEQGQLAKLMADWCEPPLPLAWELPAKAEFPLPPGAPPTLRSKALFPLVCGGVLMALTLLWFYLKTW